MANMTFPSYHQPDHLYFVTAAIVGWRKLFNIPVYASIVFTSLTWLQEQKRISLFAFVLMPSHLHVILKPEKYEISDVIQQFGSFSAHKILYQLRQEQRKELLEFFQKEKRDIRHEHSIWQDIQAKNIYSLDVLSQKMEYIHNNPIAGDHPLVKDRAGYVYSSACFYDNEKPPVIPITDLYTWLQQ